MGCPLASDFTTLEGREQRRLAQSPWGGGRQPLQAASLKVGMWLFLGADALIFLGLLTAYGLNRLYNPHWPSSEEVFGSLTLVSVMTLILISSSATMAAAVTAAQAGDRRRARWLLAATLLGGLIFLGAQAFEWGHVLAAGARPAANPWGSPVFSASFFTITGFHGLHVLFGVGYLTVALARLAMGHFSVPALEALGLYWHFVDLVWVLVFTLFYLL